MSQLNFKKKPQKIKVKKHKKYITQPIIDQNQLNSNLLTTTN